MHLNGYACVFHLLGKMGHRKWVREGQMDRSQRSSNTKKTWLNYSNNNGNGYFFISRFAGSGRTEWASGAKKKEKWKSHARGVKNGEINWRWKSAHVASAHDKCSAHINYYYCARAMHAGTQAHMHRNKCMQFIYIFCAAGSARLFERISNFKRSEPRLDRVWGFFLLPLFPLFDSIYFSENCLCVRFDWLEIANFQFNDILVSTCCASRDECVPPYIRHSA